MPKVLAGIAITLTVVGSVLVLAGLRRPVPAVPDDRVRRSPRHRLDGRCRAYGPAATSGCVLGMLLAPWGFVIANLCYALAIRDGGSESTGAEALALFATHPTLVRIGTTAGMIGCLLLVPAVLGLFRLVFNGQARAAARC